MWGTCCAPRPGPCCWLGHAVCGGRLVTMESVGDWPGQPGLRCCVASYLVILVGLVVQSAALQCSVCHSPCTSLLLAVPQCLSHKGLAAFCRKAVKNQVGISKVGMEWWNIVCPVCDLIAVIVIGPLVKRHIPKTCLTLGPSVLCEDGGFRSQSWGWALPGVESPLMSGTGLTWGAAGRLRTWWLLREFGGYQWALLV